MLPLSRLSLPEGNREMYVFDLPAVSRNLDEMKTDRKEFLRVEPIAGRLERIGPGREITVPGEGAATIYYIVRGKGRVRSGETTHEIASGSVVYAEPGCAHRFEDVTEPVEALVVTATVAPLPASNG